MNDSIRYSMTRKQGISFARVHTAVITICAAAMLSHMPVARAADPSAAMTQVCTMRANNAKLIAEDRDKGVSQQDEMRKAQGVAAAMPIERQMYAQAELSVFISRLYGQYAKMPPQEAYDKYLAYCEKQAAQGAAQVQ